MSTAATKSAIPRSGPNAPRVKVARELRGQIQSGKLRPGEPMPSERQIAGSFAVSRDTVRRALGILAIEGWVQPRPRGGYHVRGSPVDLGAPAFRGSVALVDITGGRMKPGHASSGWADWIQYGAMHTLRSSGRNTILVNEGQLSAALPERLLDAAVSGVLLPDMMDPDAPGPRQFMRGLESARVPCVAYGNESWLAEHDRICPDHAAGAAKLVEYLVARGKRRILSLLPEGDRAWIAQRRRGYERAIAKASLERLPDVRLGSGPGDPLDPRLQDSNVRHALGHLAEWLTGVARVDAILAPSDGFVFPIAAACRIVGLTPGDDVTIAGYDNYVLDCLEREQESYLPPVTIDKRNMDAGRGMAEMLLERIEIGTREPPRLRLVEPALVELDAAASG